MPRVVISEFMDIEALEAFGDDFEVIYDPDLVDDAGRLLSEIAEADALIIRNRTRVDAVLLDAAPKLKAVGRLGVGLENVDLGTCTARGVGVYPATGANTQSVVEYVIATMLILRRKAYAASADVIAGNWPRAAVGAGAEISGLTLGLVGFGAIARAVAAPARALGMEIAAYDPFLTSSDPLWQITQKTKLNDLIRNSDVISIHVPFTSETADMIDAEMLDRMKQGALLINTARGGIVDEVALATALKTGKLGGAALDVFATEPLTETAASVFAGCPNLILTPHIAGVTEQANRRVSEVTVQNILHAFETEISPISR
ncbi:MAG: hydroxyacid dehydrogenase [Pseudomonadota bacterium]